MHNFKTIRQITFSLGTSCLLMFSACGGSDNHDTSRDTGNSYGETVSYDGEYDGEELPEEEAPEEYDTDASPPYDGFVLDNSCPDVEIGDRFYFDGAYFSESNRCSWNGVQSKLDCPLTSGPCTLCFYNTEWRSCALIDYKGDCEGQYETIRTCTPMGSSEDLIPIY